MAYYQDSDGSSSSSSSDSEGAEDPLTRLLRITEEQDRVIEHSAEDALQSSSLSDDVPPKVPLSERIKRDNEIRSPQGPIARIVRLVRNSHNSGVNASDSESDSESDEEEIDRDIIARIVALRLASMDKGEEEKGAVNSNHEDPLERIRRMEEEDNHRKQQLEKRKEQAAARQKESKQPTTDQSIEPQETDEDVIGKELVRRIIAMRLATIDDEEISVHSTPEDPLVRIMNMNAEDTLVSAMSLMQYTDAQNDIDDEDDDAVIRNKDFYELNSMIQMNDLEELERRAVSLAESVKTKLSSSTLVDLTRDNDTSIDNSGIGYLALAMGGHKDVVNQSHTMNGLDISKITNDGEDDESDRRFVSMSDSILDSPSRMNQGKGKRQGLLGDLSYDQSSQSFEPEDGFISNYIGKSFQDQDDMESSNWNENGENKVLEKVWSPSYPKKKTVTKQGDSTSQAKTCLVSDWWGVIGEFAGIRSSSGDWSDSQSSLSYATTESITTDSIASLNLSMQGIQTQIDEEPSKGVQSQIVLPQQQETQSEREVLADSNTLSVSMLEEKRRRKREIEAWRLSLTKSFHNKVT